MHLGLHSELHLSTKDLFTPNLCNAAVLISSRIEMIGLNLAFKVVELKVSHMLLSTKPDLHRLLKNVLHHVLGLYFTKSSAAFLLNPPISSK